MGKSALAKEEWKKTTNPETGKRAFFEHFVGKNFRLVVLNDGSQEVWKTGNELGSDLSGALGIEGFMDGIFNAGVEMDHSDSAYVTKPGSNPRDSQV